MNEFNDPLNYYRDPEHMDHNIGAQVEAEMNLAQPHDSMDEAEQQRLKNEQAKKERERLERIRMIMCTQWGRSFFWRWMKQCKVHSELIVPNDVNLTYYNLGQRNAGLLLLMDIEQFPELYLLMVKENRGT